MNNPLVTKKLRKTKARNVIISILSRDKDFLESDVEKPLIFSPTMLYDYLTNEG